ARSRSLLDGWCFETRATDARAVTGARASGAPAAGTVVRATALGASWPFLPSSGSASTDTCGGAAATGEPPCAVESGFAAPVLDAVALELDGIGHGAGVEGCAVCLTGGAIIDASDRSGG